MARKAVFLNGPESWNTVYPGRAPDTLRHRGEVIPDALLAHLAPLGSQHINLLSGHVARMKLSFAAC